MVDPAGAEAEQSVAIHAPGWHAVGEVVDDERQGCTIDPATPGSAVRMRKPRSKSVLPVAVSSGPSPCASAWTVATGFDASGAVPAAGQDQELHKIRSCTRSRIRPTRISSVNHL
jgi:hypothetical protein